MQGEARRTDLANSVSLSALRLLVSSSTVVGNKQHCSCKNYLLSTGTFVCIHNSSEFLEAKFEVGR